MLSLEDRLSNTVLVRKSLIFDPLKHPLYTSLETSKTKFKVTKAKSDWNLKIVNIRHKKKNVTVKVDFH